MKIFYGVFLTRYGRFLYFQRLPWNFVQEFISI